MAPVVAIPRVAVPEITMARVVVPGVVAEVVVAGVVAEVIVAGVVESAVVEARVVPPSAPFLSRVGVRGRRCLVAVRLKVVVRGRPRRLGGQLLVVVGGVLSVAGREALLRVVRGRRRRVVPQVGRGGAEVCQGAGDGAGRGAGGEAGGGARRQEVRVLAPALRPPGRRRRQRQDARPRRRRARARRRRGGAPVTPAAAAAVAGAAAAAARPDAAAGALERPQGDGAAAAAVHEAAREGGGPLAPFALRRAQELLRLPRLALPRERASAVFAMAAGGAEGRGRRRRVGGGGGRRGGGGGDGRRGAEPGEGPGQRPAPGEGDAVGVAAPARLLLREVRERAPHPPPVLHLQLGVVLPLPPLEAALALEAAHVHQRRVGGVALRVRRGGVVHAVGRRGVLRRGQDDGRRQAGAGGRGNVVGCEVVADRRGLGGRGAVGEGGLHMVLAGVGAFQELLAPRPLGGERGTSETAEDEGDTK